ncbi:MAG TPA: FAD-dependent oxidoreductase [Thermoanaerobaculia bacterium]|nr:FAD-dependent oxidoreductase [Thermoanaerobaculia bacterium]
MKPVILVVDDDSESLASLADALTRRYGADYRVASHDSASAALEDLERIRALGESVALIIADQWMPGMEGIEMLGRAHEIHPAAQRALLVDWGDRSAAPAILEGCAFGQLENYIRRPWLPPEVHLYPAIGEYLAEWTRAHGHGPRMELVQVIGDDPSRRTHDLRAFLERSGIPHGFSAAGSEAGRAALEEVGLDGSRLPVVVLLDGRALVDPSNAEISDALGATNLEERECDLAIVGAGPAGLAAAVYGASEGLVTIVVEREAVGGQAGTSSLIRNYLGFPRGISGGELAQRAYEQAWLFGTKFVFAREGLRLRTAGQSRILTLSDGIEITARAVILATGARYRRLDVPGAERLVGAGIFYATPGDVRPLKDREIFVAGGGNAAGQAVIFLASGARKVTLLVRSDSLEKGMSDYLIQQILRLGNVEVRLRTQVVGVAGEHTLERLTLKDEASGQTETAGAAALFVLIGADPHTEWLAGILQRDSHGFILTGPGVRRAEALWNLDRPPTRLETSIPGVYAAGDVRRGSIKRVASAVGEGAVAVQYVHEYLAGRYSLGTGVYSFGPDLNLLTPER